MVARSRRPREVMQQKNSRHEESFGLEGEVVFACDSELCVHRASVRCVVNSPHEIRDCGEFQEE